MLGFFFQLFTISQPKHCYTWLVWTTIFWGVGKFNLFRACAAPFPCTHRIKLFWSYVFPFLYPFVGVFFSIYKCNVFCCLFVCLFSCCHAGSQRFSLKHCVHSENSYRTIDSLQQHTICFVYKLFSVVSSNTSSCDGFISSHPYTGLFKIGKYGEEEEEE